MKDPTKALSVFVGYSQSMARLSDRLIKEEIDTDMFIATASTLFEKFCDDMKRCGQDGPHQIHAWRSFVVGSRNGKYRVINARNEDEAREKARLMFGWRSPKVVTDQ